MAESSARQFKFQPRALPEVGLHDLRRDNMLADAERYAEYGETLNRAAHDYHRLSLFDDESLLELLSSHPRRRIQCFTMGTDPTRPEEWRPVCIRENDAEQLLYAVQTGRIWLNITSPERYDARFDELIRDMYTHIESMCPTVVKPEMYYNTLVLAAPGTQFYYHVHPDNNMMWNMRGELTVSALPAMDFRFVSQELLEEIFAHEASGAIPYKHDMASHAERVRAGSGECVWWPQSAPTHVAYHSFCVSLFTSYYCPMRNRRDHVQLANRYILRPLGIRNRRTEESGVRSELKQLLYRAMQRIRQPRKAYDFTDSYMADLRVDINAKNCLRRLERKLPPEFSKFASQWAVDQQRIAGRSDNHQFSR